MMREKSTRGSIQTKSIPSSVAIDMDDEILKMIKHH
jgi:hypothetical protein